MTAAERDRLILDHLPQVRFIARRIRDRLPECVSLDDLISTGILGLISAIDKFDPGHNLKLKTYAEHKIRGAILDSLRDMDWAPRQKRKRVKQIEVAITTVEQRLHREPSEDEIARELNVTTTELQGWLVDIRAVNLGSLDSGGDSGQELLRFVADAEEKWPSRIFERTELESLVDRAIETIPELERTVIRLYYKEALTLRDIAQIVGLHESRISQLKTQAIGRLRGYVRNRWPALRERSR